ncbi:MAG: glycoside hydrolase family 130 protein [Sphingomonadaceae bacterium]|nr:glycoside hydrolase family 130 protein [Sphingomonadaceae bacterium]
MVEVHHHHLRLSADPSRVVVRPFHLAWQNEQGLARAHRIVEDVLALDMRTARAELALVLRDFEARHWQTRKVFKARFKEVEAQLGLAERRINEDRKQLIGAYFCHEYSYAAAALMNPSVVPHPDQSGIRRGSYRVLMSLRAVGEGHISSIEFREGIIGPDHRFDLAPQPPFATAANGVPDPASGDEAIEVRRHRDSSLSGTVIFPVTPAQANGIEDLRLTAFTDDDGARQWIGTYTAYSGRAIRSELLRTRDFRTFKLEPMRGEAARNKGMALFPRKVDGSYMMIGRQDGENLYLLRSDDIERWEQGERILEPRHPWELIQIGNCGPPIEIEEGWLLLTHGVGAMRKYSIGAALLDKDDPSRVIGRTAQPILSPADEDREGYVPNVVYSCGAMRVGGDLFMPFGVADSSVGFAFVSIAELLRAM